jgi:hypothetical protein
MYEFTRQLTERRQLHGNAISDWNHDVSVELQLIFLYTPAVLRSNNIII